MTHQQIQALELLFLPVLELQAMVDAELEKNPVLDSEKPDDAPPEPADSDEWLNQVLKMDEESRYIRSQRAAGPSPEEEERRQHYLESVTVEQTFQELLLDQLRFLELAPELRSCCEVVISGLDDDAYLKSHPADLAMASGQNLEMVNKAIAIVQQLEPPGVAAPDLRTRLLLQLERKGQEDTPVYIAVRDYLDEIAANHLPVVAKKMDISIEELKDVILEMQALNPRLSTESVSPHEYVHEEVIISEEAGELKVKVNNDYLPNLYISKQYRLLLEDQNTPKETRDYVKEKIRSGVYLINSIIQRQTTIRKIAGAIVEMQAEFFLKDMNAMRPMTMAQVAEKVGIHETTVSRAVSGKFLRCKHGLFPLRQFFSTGYETEDGNSVSKNVVKNAIKALIEREDSYSPLSDSDIVLELEKEGYKVARRTVAKYRESMNILPSNLRRHY
ncbi:MAG: RNA polymerase sigma-54 factor [Lentisphaerae bacterium GWF2_52_8]|nr:MAG: RNA polymerase sigma-54 factor [Lentisphaerae bacterium GWF2_52_8]